MRVGLYGGSFDPPHAAHLLVAQKALARIGLDKIWWLVTPGNPMKAPSGRPALAERLIAARRLAQHPKIVVTDAEARLGTRFTIDTIRALQKRCPAVRFVWIMGADNLVNFHHWGRWDEIARAVPIAVVDRPGFTLTAMASQAAQTFELARLREENANLLPFTKPPAWIFLHGRRSDLSSTRLRAIGEWPR